MNAFKLEFVKNIGNGYKESEKQLQHQMQSSQQQQQQLHNNPQKQHFTKLGQKLHSRVPKETMTLPQQQRQPNNSSNANNNNNSNSNKTSFEILSSRIGLTLLTNFIHMKFIQHPLLKQHLGQQQSIIQQQQQQQASATTTANQAQSTNSSSQQNQLNHSSAPHSAKGVRDLNTTGQSIGFKLQTDNLNTNTSTSNVNNSQTTTNLFSSQEQLNLSDTSNNNNNNNPQVIASELDSIEWDEFKLTIILKEILSDFTEQTAVELIDLFEGRAFQKTTMRDIYLVILYAAACESKQQLEFLHMYSGMLFEIAKSNDSIILGCRLRQAAKVLGIQEKRISKAFKTLNIQLQDDVGIVPGGNNNHNITNSSVGQSPSNILHFTGSSPQQISFTSNSPTAYQLNNTSINSNNNNNSSSLQCRIF